MEKEVEGIRSQPDKGFGSSESPPSYQEVLKWQAANRKPIFVDNGNSSVEFVEVQSNEADVCKNPVASSRETIGSSVVDIDSIQVECNITGSIHGSAEIRCLMEEMKNQQKYNSNRHQGQHQSTLRQVRNVFLCCMHLAGQNFSSLTISGYRNDALHQNKLQLITIRNIQNNKWLYKVTIKPAEGFAVE